MSDKSDEFQNETPEQRAFQAFEVLVTGNDSTIDLAVAALLIACIEYPALDITHSMAQLDALALRVRALLNLPDAETLYHLPPEIASRDVIESMNKVLFEQEGFHGNQMDYYNPRNSFLNDVLELRTGIPITLSLLYIEVGKRVGVRFDGIGLPYHFVVSHRLSDGTLLYIDPFEEGSVYDEQTCRARVRRMLKGRPLYPQWFEPVKRRQFLVRMLNNLKNIYLYKEQYNQALAICNRILLLVPHASGERRDRGIVYFHLKQYTRALRDLTAYIEETPEADDLDEVRRQIKALRQIISMMN